MRTYLIVGNLTNEIYDEIGADFILAYANREAKRCAEYYEEPCRVVRAVCDPNSNDSRWSCGKTFTQAEANFRKGIFDNWAEC